MPLRSGLKSKKYLVSKGISYQILFSYKQDSKKQIFKAIRKDEREDIEQEVLLKIFLNEKKDYQKEFGSLSRVLSPYCVRLLGFEKFSNKRALVLEYIKGVSLSQLIENFSLSEKEIQYILISIYKGLLDLSRQGFCHGDLSLDNVLIDEKAHIKLIDFGEANYDQEVHGTPPFIAPEIFQGARANFLSDLFSLGVIETILKTPYPLSSLKEMQLKDFESSSPLLSLDPKKRIFSCDKMYKIQEQDLKILSYKVKDLLIAVESRHCSTLKNPKINKKNFLFPFRFLTLVFVLLFAVSSSQASSPLQGILKVYTNKWLFISIDSFQSYSPLSLPLKEGWYIISWRDQSGKGQRKIFIPKGKTILLKDKHFLRKGKTP